ncbi:glycogen debranching enzyme GlgX [Agromyces protaetiae]|uniref:Glycogen debranching enzyme GlgX n=1 Tax=Agromyces protaetiae TaxID=2509455 RepID=A0A4P6FH34_9MICO|nr:glycogen debranching protein GlgX [Agromyces protaetiae]QAY73819.1 glycogen debranching enzyme GlgX [Agromyces protaetiae]
MPAADPLTDLGVLARPDGGTLRLWSENATSVELLVFDPADLDWAVDRVEAVRDEHGVWEASSPLLVPGSRYGVSVDGPTGPGHAFNPVYTLLDPYARGLARADDGSWRGVALGALDDGSWQRAPKPDTPLDRSVVYEAHVRGFSRLNHEIPKRLRGTYAGLAHDASIDYLKDLGVTAVELLPVHAFVSEERLLKQGKVNYWGYNTLAFFTPHPQYATAEAQKAGPDGVRREFAGMVDRLHAAGLEVILDVVYNHTAEEGLSSGKTYSFRGIDNAGYYRHDAHGRYVDTTGCGNTLDFGNEAPSRLVLDSMRYWADELGVDGFRLDLAATLGRGDHGEFEAGHPLLAAMLADPVLSKTKLIAEPWDVGPGGWQTGNFPAGFTEWNDRYRDRMRDFWLGDLRRERKTGEDGSGIGRFATRLAGSSNTFAAERGPLASLNFITAHDGFTLADLTAYDRKHNEGNGESNRDGSDNNNSYNHGVEGESADAVVRAARRRSIRNLLGTLLFSSGVPMLTAGDEFGRSQRGNNNAYCHDSRLTWLAWDAEERPRFAPELLATTKHLIRLRKENPALRPVRYKTFGERTPGASNMDWYSADGDTMTIDDWNSPAERTLQFLAASTPMTEPFNRILLVVHARETETEVVLPAHEGVGGYTLLWDSGDEMPDDVSAAPERALPGDRVAIGPCTMRLYRAEDA